MLRHWKAKTSEGPLGETSFVVDKVGMPMSSHAAKYHEEIRPVLLCISPRLQEELAPLVH